MDFDLFIFFDSKQYYERESPAPDFEDANGAHIKDYEAYLLEANLHTISTNVKLEYERINPSVQIDDLDIPKCFILNAVVKYGELLKAQINVKKVFSNYQTAYQQVEGPKQFIIERAGMGNSIHISVERTYFVNQVYRIFIEFSLNVIKVLLNIVNNSNNPWENVIIPHKAELLEIVNRRLIACANVLENCNELQTIVLNVLYPTIDIFNELGENFDHHNFECFLDTCRNLMINGKKHLKELGFKHKIKLLLNKGERVPRKHQYFYEKRKRFNDEESTFKKAIKDWKKKAYAGGTEEDNSSSESDLSSPRQNIKRIKVS